MPVIRAGVAGKVNMRWKGIRDAEDYLASIQRTVIVEEILTMISGNEAQ